MRFLKRALIGIVVIVVVAVGVAYLLPREVSVERTARIDAAPEAIFPYGMAAADPDPGL